MAYKVHPVAELFPMIPKGTHLYNDLEEHIRLFGQLEPIVVDGDVLLDGRNRLAICLANGITPKVVQWSSLGIKNPQHEWIFGKNVARRNLTEDQRAQIYVEYNAWAMADEARQRQAEAKFKEGNSESSKGGQAKAGKLPTRTESYEPAKRDHKAENARSTIGKIAAGAGISHGKAAKLIAVNKAAKAGDEKAKSDIEAVKAGLKTLRDVKPPKAPESKPKPTLEEQFEAKWKRFMDSFAVADHPEVLKLIKGKL